MIQRIQSIYLFLAALFMGGLFLHSADLMSIDTTKPSALSDMSYLNDKILDIYDQGILIAFVGIVMVFSLLALFLFRNRKLQITLSRVSMLVVLLFLVLTAYLSYSDLWPFISSVHIALGFGIFIPILVIICLVLAVRGIRKDDKLVKGMDRLR